ncbi:hypothetical protein [Vibrio phage 29Fa.3]|nr:hypothetical protein [Vibrio phage 29Fa.3]
MFRRNLKNNRGTLIKEPRYRGAFLMQLIA